MDKLTTVLETQKHIRTVKGLLIKAMARLMQRLDDHDSSKLEEPELSIFTEYTPKLKSSTYGSKEYKGYLKEMKVALDHHYEANRHHPEHFHNGVEDMTLVDLIEMVCDWKAASLRHKDGDIMKSIEINAERFDLSAQLIHIIQNTVEVLEDE